jgi:hypothetical protein
VGSEWFADRHIPTTPTLPGTTSEVGYPACLRQAVSLPTGVSLDESFQVECHSYSFARVVVRSHGALPREDKPKSVGCCPCLRRSAQHLLWAQPRLLRPLTEPRSTNAWPARGRLLRREPPLLAHMRVRTRSLFAALGPTEAAERT